MRWKKFFVSLWEKVCMIYERTVHIEERLQIMDQDKWEELVDRLTQIEDQGRELLLEPGGGYFKNRV